MKGIFAKGVITETFTPLTLAEFLERRVTARLSSHLNLIDLSYKDSLMVKDITERVTHHVCDILASINPQDMGINLEEDKKDEATNR